jgi:hypothetical protein
MNYQRARATVANEEMSTGIEELLRHFSISFIISHINQVHDDGNCFGLNVGSPADIDATCSPNVLSSSQHFQSELSQRSAFSKRAIDDRVERIEIQMNSTIIVEGVKPHRLEQAQLHFNARPERGNLIEESSIVREILSFLLSDSQLRQGNIRNADAVSRLGGDSFNAFTLSMAQVNDIANTIMTAEMKGLGSETGRNLQSTSSLFKPVFLGLGASTVGQTSQLQPRQISASRLERLSSDKDPELERVKKAIDMLERLTLDNAGRIERTWEGIKEFGLPTKLMVEIIDSINESAVPGSMPESQSALTRAIDVAVEKYRLDKTLPDDKGPGLRHQAGAAYAKSKLGAIDARTIGILNEFYGSYQLSDLIDNEIGLQGYAYELLQYVRRDSKLADRYYAETGGNPFRHIAIELAHNYPERYNLGTVFSPKPEGGYNLGVSKSYESGKTAINNDSSPGHGDYNLGVILPELPEVDSSDSSSCSTESQQSTGTVSKIEKAAQ